MRTCLQLTKQRPELFGFSKWFDSIGRSFEAVFGRESSLFFWARSAIIKLVPDLLAMQT